MERTSFEKLQVYRLAERLADPTGGIVARWDRFAKNAIGRQLVQAADSMDANIAEGLGSRRGTGQAPLRPHRPGFPP